jgi:hypothetical protein
MIKEKFSIEKFTGNRWSISYDGDYANGKKAFSVNESGAINEIEYFATKSKAMKWINEGFPLCHIDKACGVTHYVWAKNITEARSLEPQANPNALDSQPIEYRNLLSNFANDAGLNVYDPDTQTILSDYMDHHADMKMFK